MRDRIEQLDKADMWSAIKDCPQQIIHILDAYQDWEPQRAAEPPRQILFLGMGGSAIGGDMVRVWVERLGEIPMTVVRDYRVPRWVGAGTRVLASSYSGATEETLAAAEQAAGQGARMAAIASGGELSSLSQDKGWDFVQIPGGLQPRAAIGYSLAAVARVLVAFKVLPRSVLDELEAGARIMEAEGERWSDPDQPGNVPLETAKLIGERLPAVYGAVGTTEALAVRLKGQLAENSKLLAGHHLLPEQNHNEIVGLAERIRNRCDALVIWLTDEDDHPRVTLRRELAGQLMGTGSASKGDPPMECTLAGDGASLIQRNLSLLHQIDWLSYYAALLGGYDPSAIEILVKLKSELKNR